LKNHPDKLWANSELPFQTSKREYKLIEKHLPQLLTETEFKIQVSGLIQSDLGLSHT
jgi:uncharacterized protein YqeY